MENRAVKNEGIPRESNPDFLYKFRSFKNFNFIEDILRNERLYCSLYRNLNDPFEGIFISYIYSKLMTFGGPKPRFKPRKKRKKYKTVDELLSGLKVCSLSSDFKDVRLWAYYADGNKGIAIKINFKDINSSLYRVEYSENLPEFEGKNNINPIDILTRKTHHWRFESEYRIINAKDYYVIKDRINSILLAPDIDNECLKLLMKIVPGKIPIFSTKLNMEEIKIERNERMN